MPACGLKENEMKAAALLALLLSFAALCANYVENQPFEHVQPDGTVLSLFVSGDEYYHRVHDAKGYTILPHPQTGYAVYALPDGNSLRASEHIVGRVDPTSLGLQPNLYKQDPAIAQRWKQQQALRDAGNKGSPTGTLNNVVGFVRFNDQTNFPSTPSYTSYYNNFMSTSQQSLADFYDEVSSGQLDINSYLYPGAGTGGYPMSFQVDHDRDYYSPYNASTNPDGYTTDAQGQTRMWNLVVELLGMIDDYIPAGLDLDNDNDGIIDGLTFIFRGLTDGWGDILWPAHWTWGSSLGTLNGASVTHYVFDFEGSSPPTGVSVICHEMGHMIGFPDLYHYTSNGITPVGSWSLMASDNAQHETTHEKKRYGTWFTTIPTITPTTTPTQYTLTAIDQDPYDCYRINSNLANEYYMLEYRRDTGRYESGIPGSGLIVYRIIDTFAGDDVVGNADGPPDEVYVYRPGGDIDTNGTTSSANLSSTVSRTKIHTGADPEPWLYSNTGTQLDGNLCITDIGASGGTTITFIVRDSPPNIWDGSSSTAWTTASNWSLNHVPTIDEDVEVPGSLVRYPIVSTTQYCRSLLVKTGASLTISTGDLVTVNDYTSFGSLVMNDASGSINVGRDLFFESGSTATISANAYIYVNSDVEFRTGSNINMGNGSLWFIGTGASYARVYQAATIYHLRSDKNATYISGISGLSTASLTLNGGLYVYDGSTFTHPSMYSLIVKGSIYSYAGGLLTFGNGTVSMEGTTNNYISLADAGNYLNNLTINKGGANYVYLSNPLTVESNLTINAGILQANTYTITLGGNWDNNVGVANFIEGTGRVILNGTGTQTVSTETFNILELNKSAGIMSIPTGSTVTCASYDWTAGAYTVSGGIFTAADLADGGVFGTITLTSGTIDYTQDTSQYVDLRCNLTINGGTFNVNGGSSVCWFSYIDIASLTMTSGTLDIKNQSIRIPSSYAFNETISGGTISTVGSFYCERGDYNPTGGTLEFYGSANCTWQNTAGSNVYRVYIDKSATREGSGLWQSVDPRDRDLRTEPPNRLNQVTGTGPLDINNNLVINAGVFVAPATINIAGGWYNYLGPDAFVEGTGTVIFDGAGHQYCNYTETFNAIQINKSGGALRVQSSTAVVTCASYNWTAGAVDVLTGTFTATDLAQDGIYGNFYNNTGGTINLYQGTDQMIDLNGFIYNYGGTYNIYGGSMSCYPAWNANAGIEMSAGVIDFRNKGITIVPRPSTLTINVTGGAIRTVSWFSDTRGGIVFAGGEVELYSSTSASVTLGTGSRFHDLKINKAPTRDSSQEGTSTPWKPNNNHEPEVGDDYRLNDVAVGSALIITNDLTIAAGILTNTTGSYNITVGGNWTNSVGNAGFVPGTGTVFFNKAGDQQFIYGMNVFYNVTDNHTGAALNFEDANTLNGTLTVNSIVAVKEGCSFAIVNHIIPGAILAFYYNYDSTIGSYTGGGILRCYSSHYLTINDLTQNGLYGTYLVDGSNLEVHQDAANWIDLNGPMTIQNNGIVDLYGGSMDCYTAYSANASLTMTSGEFNVKNYGLYIYNNLYTFDFAVSGGTIRANGNWTDSWGIFDPTGGTVEMTGSGDNIVNPHASSWFWTLKVNKVATRESATPERLFDTDKFGRQTPITRSCNLNVYASTLKGGLLIEAANIVYLYGAMNSTNSGLISVANGTLRLNGHNLTSTGNITVASYGTLRVDPASNLFISNARTLTVYNLGSLLVVGNTTNAATITHNSTGYYGISVNTGGTLGGYYGIFEYLNASGIVLNPGSLVDTLNPLDYCTFRMGASGGKLLAINNSQSFTVTGASFPTNTWGGAYNVSKTVDGGIVYFADWSGAFGGPAFEQDTYNHVYWEGYGIPPIIDLSIQHIPATNRVQLDWTYPLTATSYKIYRSTDPYGTFTHYATAYTNSWYQTVPTTPPYYFYKVTAVVP